MNKDNIYNSALFSLYSQIIIGIICLFGVFIPLKPEDNILNSILLMETIVQMIEFIFYYWLVSNIYSISYDVTYIRYFDWFLTTPTMLISIILFMIYKTSDKIINFYDTINDNKENIFYIILFNALMLIFGFLGEIGLLSKYISFIVGSLFFMLSFKYIYDNYVNNNETNEIIFYVNFVIWSLYGVAFLLSYSNKNVMYNVLDIFSKNMNGLLLFFFIIYKKFY